MKAVTFYFRELKSTQRFHRFVLSFFTFTVDLTLGKILNIQEESQYVKHLYSYHYSLRTKAFISANTKVSVL